MNINKGPITGPKYLPHMQHKDVISMGMQPLDECHWIEPDAHYPRYLEHKLTLIGYGTYCSCFICQLMIELVSDHALLGGNCCIIVAASSRHSLKYGN